MTDLSLRNTELMASLELTREEAWAVWEAMPQEFTLEEELHRAMPSPDLLGHAGALVTLWLIAKEGIDTALAIAKLVQILKQLKRSPSTERRQRLLTVRLGSKVEKTYVQGELSQVTERSLMDLRIEQFNEPAVPVNTSNMIELLAKARADAEKKSV